MSTIPQQQYSVEDHENPKYRCCCQCCHVTTGSIAIAVVEMVFVLFYILRGIVFLARPRDHEYTSSSVISVIAAFIGLGILGALLFGVLKQKKYFLIPFLIAQVIVILIQIAMVIVCIVYLFNGNQALLPVISASNDDPRELEPGDSWSLIFYILIYVVLGIYLLGAALGCWFFYVVLYCYVYFKDTEMSKVETADRVELRGGASTDSY